MKYFKIIKTNKKGLGVISRNESKTGQFIFSNKDIFLFYDLGDRVYEVEPINKIKDNSKLTQIFSCDLIDLKFLGNTLDLKVIKYLIKNGAILENNYLNLLLDSVKKDKINIIKFLNKKGLDLTISDNYALILAIEKNNFKIVKYLVKNGADPKSNDNYAIRLAYQNKNDKIINFLNKIT